MPCKLLYFWWVWRSWHKDGRHAVGIKGGAGLVSVLLPPPPPSLHQQAWHPKIMKPSQPQEQGPI